MKTAFISAILFAIVTLSYLILALLYASVSHWLFAALDMAVALCDAGLVFCYFKLWLKLRRLKKENEN